jgi:hypothetical protein
MAAVAVLFLLLPPEKQQLLQAKMKKILILSAICSILLITGSYAQTKKVAVVTFYIVKQIDVSDFGTANTAAAVARLGDDPGFNLAPVLKKFHDQFFEEYAKNFPFGLLPENQVINNSLYKDFIPDGGAVSDILKVDANLPAQGYKVILPLKRSDNEKNLLKIFDQCDGVMKIYIDFDLEKKGFGGVGIAKVNAHANIILFNKNGEKVFSLKEEALSKISGAIITGIPFITPEKVLPLCESAMDELMVALQKDLPEKVKKADRKL